MGEEKEERNRGADSIHFKRIAPRAEQTFYA